MGQIVAKRATLQVGRRELGLTRDKYTRAPLRRRLATNLASGSGWTRASTVAAPANLQNWVDAFSESYTLSAVDNLGEYFRRLAVHDSLPLLARRRGVMPR